MSVKEELKEIIETSAPLWAGEAEVVRTYFNWSKRSNKTDRKWLAHQCFKEFYGSGYGEPEHGLLVEWGQQMIDRRPELDHGLDRHELLEFVQGIYDEYHHYCLFADIFDSLTETEHPKLQPNMLENWTQGKTLDDYRLKLRQEHGDLGKAAMDFTEGGYCTLYSEGAKLAGRGGLDEKIASACQRVYEDEVGHMLKGIVALDEYNLDADGWALVKEKIVGQLRLRILMRNGQFSFPLSEERINEIFSGQIEHLAFDYTITDAAA